MSSSYDLGVIGGGIVGCATALALSRSRSDLNIALFEKESRLAAHQTGHNSGVIHAGLYYRPGSVKARTCVAGREDLYRFCVEHTVPHRQCGKVVAAIDETELPALDELERRGRANGLDGLERLSGAEIRRHEPAVRAVAGLYVPQTGIVDFVQVTEKMAELFRLRGGTVQLDSRVRGLRRSGDGWQVQTDRERFECRYLVNCAGLYADRVARLAGAAAELRIVPFRGEYFQIRPARRALVKNLIYPVPDPAMPFLGVHFTRMIDGTVEAGPNAVLAWHREGYHWSDVSLRDLGEIVTYPGFWKLAARFWRVGLYEYWRSFSKPRFVRSLERLIPDIRADDLELGGSGVRAQAVDGDGQLVDDFRIQSTEKMLHVLNAPSPAATASLSIGEQVADEVGRALDS